MGAFIRFNGHDGRQPRGIRLSLTNDQPGTEASLRVVRAKQFAEVSTAHDTPRPSTAVAAPSAESARLAISPSAQPSKMEAVFDVPSVQLGLPPAPVALNLMISKQGVRWTMLIHPQVATPRAPLLAWVQELNPRRLEFGPDGSLRADFEPPPLVWERNFASLDVNLIVLALDGVAQVTLTGTRQSLATFSRVISMADEAVELRRLATTARSTNPLLTPAQEEALRAAVSAGYYQIPRPLNLHDLAAHLHVTAASLSERLRRAEQRVITRFVSEGMPTLAEGAHGGMSPTVNTDRPDGTSRRLTPVSGGVTPGPETLPVHHVVHTTPPAAEYPTAIRKAATTSDSSLEDARAHRQRLASLTAQNIAAAARTLIATQKSVREVQWVRTQVHGQRGDAAPDSLGPRRIHA